MSCGLRSQTISGWRRTMPEAVQGASSKMPSNGLPSHQSCGAAASAVRRLACSPKRCKVSAMRWQRWASTSSAVTAWLASSSRCAVLPPGAAQASSRRSGAGWAACWLARALRASSSNGAASCAPASCTETQPCAKPGKCCTAQGWCNTMPALPVNAPDRPAACKCVCK